MRSLLVGLVCTLAFACSSTTAPIEGGLAVKAAPPNLQLSNQSPAPVYVFAIEAGLAPLANWAPCTDPARCRSIRGGGTAEFAYTDIAGYSATARQAIVYWWHLVPRDGGFAPDSIRAVGTEL